MIDKEFIVYIRQLTIQIKNLNANLEEVIKQMKINNKNAEEINSFIKKEF